jgi:hypothetical protein
MTPRSGDLDRYFNFVRRKLGFTYWSLSAWAKLKVKNAVNFIGAFEETLSTEATAPGWSTASSAATSTAPRSRISRHPLHELRRLGGELHGPRREL